MSATATRTATPRRVVSPEMYETVIGTVYAGLATNLLLAVACLPFVVVLATADPVAAWPVLAATAPLAAPGLVAAFAVFEQLSAHGAVTPVRTFVRAYRRHFRRALAVGALATGAVVVLAVDVVAVWGARVGAAAIPVLVTLGLLAVTTATTALVAVPEMPGTRLRDLLRASLFLAVRRWYVSAGALVVLAMLAAVVVTKPAVGLGFVAAPLLFVVWGGCRFALRTLAPAT